MNIRLAASLLALPLLAACAPQVETTIYLADVQKVVEDGQALATPAVIRIPQEGEEDCKKGLDALIEKFRALAPTTGKGQCISKDGDQLAEIETQVQIVTPDAAIAQPNLFALVATRADDGSTALAFHVLKPISEVITALASENAMSTDFDPTRFYVHINNDGRDSVQLVPGEVFVDGEPHLAGGDPVELQRRGEILIKFNDVAAAFTEKGNAYPFVTILSAN